MLCVEYAINLGIMYASKSGALTVRQELDSERPRNLGTAPSVVRTHIHDGGTLRIDGSTMIGRRIIGQVDHE